MSKKAFDNPDVEATFQGYPSGLRSKLLTLRRMILDVAADTPDVGELEETLKWGQPSYLTSTSRSGTTIRIGPATKTSTHYALFVHCQTDLIATFKTLYPDVFTFDGKRAIVFAPEDDLPKAELRHCIALALTYHRRKKKAARAA